MKKLYCRILLLLCIIAWTVPDADGQILGRLKRKLEDKIEKKMEDELDKELSKKVDKELGQDTSLRQDNREGGYDRTAQALLEGMIGSKWDMSDVELPSSYQFEAKITYELTQEKGRPTQITYYFPKRDENILGFVSSATAESQGVMYVWDISRNVIVLYQENSAGEKIKMKLPNLSQGFISSHIDSATNHSTTMEKTGRTKLILGFLCEEYKIDTDGGTQRVWITNELPHSFHVYRSLFSQQSQNPEAYHLLSEEAMMLEMHTISEEGEEMTMKALEYKDSPFRISNEEYADQFPR